MFKESDLYRCVGCLSGHLILSKHSLECTACALTYPVNTFPNFIAKDDLELEKLEKIYPAGTIVQRYKNFLNWLTDTFRTTEIEFRREIFSQLELRHESRILITGAGTGEDIKFLVKELKRTDLKIHFQDASEEMLSYTIGAFIKDDINFEECNLSNASILPYQSNIFDSVIHFGGINYFSEKKLAIEEMHRVCKPKGQIVFGDEGVAPWLRETEYGKMMILNNSLWAAHPPLEFIPYHTNNFNLKYILENCFYVISLIKDTSFPTVDLDVTHKSPRGGSIRTRWQEHQTLIGQLSQQS
jgi:SAM-dependent methyltransferase